MVSSLPTPASQDRQGFGVLAQGQHLFSLAVFFLQGCSSAFMGRGYQNLCAEQGFLHLLYAYVHSISIYLSVYTYTHMYM